MTVHLDGHPFFVHLLEKAELVSENVLFQFVKYAVEMGVAGEDGEDVADVHAYAFVVGRGVGSIAGEGFLVAVECQAYELAFGVQHRGA